MNSMHSHNKYKTHHRRQMRGWFKHKPQDKEQIFQKQNNKIWDPETEKKVPVNSVEMKSTVIKTAQM